MRDPERPAIFLDLEDVIIEVRPGRTLPIFSMRPGADEGLRRLAQLTDTIVALIEPTDDGSRKRPIDRLVGVRAPMVRGGPEVLFVGCPHEGTPCSCRKPGSGLIEEAVRRHRIDLRGGWHIGGDAEGVQTGRSAGLRTVRIGPPSDDPESAVHRADYDARDLLDAANWILVQALGQPAA